MTQTLERELPDFLREWQEDQMERLLKRYNIARSDNEVLDLTKLAHTLFLHNCELLDELADLKGIKKPKNRHGKK